MFHISVYPSTQTLTQLSIYSAETTEAGVHHLFDAFSDNKVRKIESLVVPYSRG
jgi:hypothetical protein